MRALEPAAVLAIAIDREPTLLQVVAQIVAHPHREIVVDTPLVEMEGLTEPDTERFLELIADPGSLAPAPNEPVHFDYDGGQFQFTRVYDARPRATFDTVPNRFARYVLGRYVEALLSTGSEEARALARSLQGALHGSAIMEASQLHHVSTDHNVLRKDPNYREILRCHVELGHLTASPPEA